MKACWIGVLVLAAACSPRGTSPTREISGAPALAPATTDAAPPSDETPPLSYRHTLRELENLCLGGDPRACREAARLYADRDYFDLALHYSRRACARDEGETDLCVEIATEYADGVRALPADMSDEDAVEAFAGFCFVDPRTCAPFRDAVERQLSARADPDSAARGLAVFARAYGRLVCEPGAQAQAEPRHCTNMKAWVEAALEQAHLAPVAFRRVCTVRRRYCHEIAVACAQASACAELVQELRAAALRVSGDTCRFGDADECVHVGYQHLTGDAGVTDAQLAVTLFDEGCNAGSAWGCNAFADVLYAGEVVEGDPDRAVELYGVACKAGEAAACFALGRLHLRGEMVVHDLAKARELFAKACALGSQAGCAFVKRGARD